MFNTVDRRYNFHITGFELWISGVCSNRSTTATPTALYFSLMKIVSICATASYSVLTPLRMKALWPLPTEKLFESESVKTAPYVSSPLSLSSEIFGMDLFFWPSHLDQKPKSFLIILHLLGRRCGGVAAVWPDLAKFRHFGQRLIISGKLFERFNWCLALLWTYFGKN